MQHETKKLGELLVEAGLITPTQLQETLRHQRIAGGRMGSNLVGMGILSEASLMDFLARQTGVPRMDLKQLDVSVALLEKIPRRLAEQMTILPVAFKEPKSLVLAMADPMDLNAIDSARFASGMTIEPVVAAHTALKQAIQDQYRKLEGGGPLPLTVEVGGPHHPVQEALSVPFETTIVPYDPRSTVPPGTLFTKDYPRDPFFDDGPVSPPVEAPNPFSFFTDPKPPAAPGPRPGPLPQPQIIHARSAASEKVQPLESYATRALLLGLIKMLQRRGILGEDELQRGLANLIESGEVNPKE